MGGALIVPVRARRHSLHADECGVVLRVAARPDVMAVVRRAATAG